VTIKEAGSLKQIISTNVKMNRLVASAAASYIAAFVLGIRDRHYDNILVRSDGTLFHIDYSYILGDKVRFDTSKFAVTPELESLMGKDRYADFVELAIELYSSLRRNEATVVEFMCSIMRLLPDMADDRLREFFRQSLLLNKEPEEACAYLRQKLFHAPSSLKTRAKNFIHGLATKNLLSS